MLEEAFKRFVRCIDCYISCYYEFQTTQVTGDGIRLSRTILMEAVVFHFRTIDRYKVEHDFPEGARANFAKVGAFTAYWLAVKRPLYDVKDEVYAPMVNTDFALFTGLTLAKIDPHQARVLLDGKIYDQIKNLLANHNATPDALVPLFETLYAQFPDEG